MQDTALLPRLQNQDRSVSTSSGLRAPDRIQVSLWQLPEGHVLIFPSVSYVTTVLPVFICCVVYRHDIMLLHICAQQKCILAV